jgi:RimJ/RimL family protein N-acetyltransferase
MTLQLPKEGDGFLLRSFTHEDAAALAEIEFDPVVKQFLAIPKKAKIQWIQEDFHPDYYCAWAIEVGDCLAGRAFLLPVKEGVKELVIVIGRSFLGKKLGRKVADMLIHAAFTELNTKTLLAVVHPENLASIKLLKAFKFRHRGKVPSEQKQAGNLIYRLTRGTYNS